jgi:hypothetical protein
LQQPLRGVIGFRNGAQAAELTHRCPLGCPYCSNPLALDAREDELDTTTWLRIFREAAQLGVLQVHLSGGEPGAQRDLADITAGAHLILPRLVGTKTIRWRSPLVDDQYAEYRDAGFLDRLGLKTVVLGKFWPDRGPQWDALAQCDVENVLLVEAKSHVAELCSSPAGAEAGSLQKLQAALKEAATFIGAEPRAPWYAHAEQVTGHRGECRVNVRVSFLGA